jgi:6-phosphogluconolactonase
MPPNRFFLAANTGLSNGGIYQYSLDGATLTQTGFFPLQFVNSLTSSPDGRFLYATCQPKPIGTVAAFKLTASGLEFINSVPSGAALPCISAVNARQTFLYAANYGDNGDSALSEFPLAPDGRIGEATKVIRHSGSGPVTNRQAGPHVHCAAFTPDSRYLIVCDLGTDTVESYPFDSEKGIDVSAVLVTPMPPGCGPRLIIFEPDGTIAYLVAEIGNIVLSLRFNEGLFEVIESVSTIPSSYCGSTKTAAIRFSPERKSLLITNRGYDSVAIIAIDNHGGLVLKNIVYCIGEGPRDMGFVDGTNIVLVMNKETHNVAIFEYLQEKYTLVPVGVITFPLPSPTGFLG